MTTLVSYTTVSPNDINGVFEGVLPEYIKLHGDSLQYFMFIVRDIHKDKYHNVKFIYNCFVIVHDLYRLNVKCNWFIKKYAYMFIDLPKYYNRTIYLRLLQIAGCFDLLKLVVNRPQFNLDDRRFDYIFCYDMDIIAVKMLEFLQRTKENDKTDDRIVKVVDFILEHGIKFANYDKLLKLNKKIRDPATQCRCSLNIYRRFTL